jgi:plasmid stability protein
MAQVIVRKLEKSVVLKLKRRAAREGLSMEEKLRQDLRALVSNEPPRPKMNFKEFLLTVPDFGDEADAYRKKTKWRKIDLD